MPSYILPDMPTPPVLLRVPQGYYLPLRTHPSANMANWPYPMPYGQAYIIIMVIPRETSRSR